MYVYLLYITYHIYTAYRYIHREREASAVLQPHLDGNIPFDF